MRALVQRVRRAAVRAAGVELGAIGPGLCVFVGVTHGDDAGRAARLAERLAGLRIFPDRAGRVAHSVSDVAGGVLVVSQFTLYAQSDRGRRPSFSAAAPGEIAEPLVIALIEALRARGLHVESGRFGAEMEVELVNDGPFTLLLEA